MQHIPNEMILLTKKRFKLQAIIDFAGRYIYHDNHENTEYNCICSAAMDGTIREFAIKMGIIYISMICAFIGPTHAYIAYGVKTSWTSERIPFTVPNSADEFLINILLQTIIFVHAIWAYFALEVACTLSANVVNVAPRLSTNDLAHTIQRYNDKNISRLELRCEMRNFVKSTCDTDK